jgi:hypothetical protein
VADPSRAAIVTSVVAFMYLLALWWIRSGAGPFVEDVVFVVVVVPVVVALGHLAGLVSLAGVVRRTGDVPAAPRRGRLLVLASGVMGIALIALASRSLFLSDVESSAPDPFPILGGTGSVVVIGIDGLDADLLATLAERGALGGLLRSLEEGATFPMRRSRDGEPAEVWTTIATGLSGRAHGVHGAHAGRLPGVGTTLRGALPLWDVWRGVLPLRAVPTTRTIRRAPAVWEIASGHLGTAVVGWWTSWPAPPDASTPESAPRYVITDRVLPKLLAGSPADRDTAPAALFSRIASRFPEEVAGLRTEFSTRFEGVEETRASWVWESLLIDAFACDRIAELAADPGVRAAFVYLPGLDILRHRLSSAGGRADEAVNPALLDLFALYVTALDDRLGTLRVNLDRTTVLVADPGRTGAPEGFVSVRGPAARSACVGSPMTELDVAPLVLRLLGFPRSLEMEGHAPDRCLDAPAAPLGSVPSYGRLPPAERRATSASDPEILERLRSLGYLR